MPLGELAEDKLVEQPDAFTPAEIAAELEMALWEKGTGRSRVDQKNTREAAASSFARHQVELEQQPQYASDIKRQILAETMGHLTDPRLVLTSARHWAGQALDAIDLVSHKDPVVAEQAQRALIKEAMKNFTVLSASRRLNDMQQFAKMTVTLLHDVALDAESRASLLDVLNQLLYAQLVNVQGGEQAERASVLADLKHDLIRRILFDLGPAKLVTPASADEVEVVIDLDRVEIKEGVPLELLRAEGGLLTTIAHLPNEEFTSFLRQQIDVYQSPQRQLQEMLRVLRELYALKQAVIGQGNTGGSALLKRNDELGGVPQAVANALQQKLQILARAIRKRSEAIGPEGEAVA